MAIYLKQAGAELSQAQVKDEAVVKVRSWSCRWCWIPTTNPGSSGKQCPAPA